MLQVAPSLACPLPSCPPTREHPNVTRLAIYPGRLFLRKTALLSRKFLFRGGPLLWSFPIAVLLARVDPISR